MEWEVKVVVPYLVLKLFYYWRNIALKLRKVSGFTWIWLTECGGEGGRGDLWLCTVGSISPCKHTHRCPSGRWGEGSSGACLWGCHFCRPRSAACFSGLVLCLHGLVLFAFPWGEVLVVMSMASSTFLFKLTHPGGWGWRGASLPGC